MDNKILIIEDEKDLAKILGAYLEVEGFEAVIAKDGQEGLLLFTQQKPSLVLLDIMLPIIDGIQVCKRIRETSDVPIIMISAKSGEMDKVIALGIGADDYVTKPFSPLELVARVKAQLRRFEKTLKQDNSNVQVLSFGRLQLNKASYTVMVDQQNVALTTKEFDMLFYLASHENQVFTKEQIYEGVWGYSEYGEDNSVTVYINRLRDKLSKYEIDYIKTVWGVGYKMTTAL